MGKLERKHLLTAIAAIVMIVIVIVGVLDKRAEIRPEKQWAAQMVLFCQKAIAYLEPSEELETYDEFFGYFESEAVVGQLDELERLFFMQKEFVEHHEILRQKWEPSLIGKNQLIGYKELQRVRQKNETATEEEKKRLYKDAWFDIAGDDTYFSTTLDDIISGRTAMKVPSAKDIAAEQARLDEYVMTDEGLTWDDRLTIYELPKPHVIPIWGL